MRNQFMKRGLPIIAGLAMVVAAAAVVAAADEHPKASAAAQPQTSEVEQTKAAAPEHPHAEAPAEASFTGEVLDLTCYASHPATGSGADHASCAKTCLEKGLPVGLLVGDKVFVVVMKDHSAPNKTFAPYAAQMVTVKGIAKDLNGTQVLSVTQFTPPTDTAKK